MVFVKCFIWLFFSVSWFFCLKQQNLRMNIKYMKRGITFVRKVLRVKQGSISPFLYDQYQNLTLVYLIGFCISAWFKLLRGVTEAEMHCPCSGDKTILNMRLLSIRYFPFRYTFSWDRWFTAPNLFRSWCLCFCLCVHACNVCMYACACDLGPVRTVRAAILIKLQLTVCNLMIVINSKTIPFHQISSCVSSSPAFLVSEY